MTALMAASTAVRGGQLVNTLGYPEHAAVCAFDCYINRHISAFLSFSRGQMYHFGRWL